MKLQHQALVTIYALLYSGSVYAYIDPASGSAIVSAIIGFIVAIGLAIKGYWYKIKSFFTKDNPDSDSKPPLSQNQKDNLKEGDEHGTK